MLDSMNGVWTHDRLKVKEWTGQPVTFIQPKYDGWFMGFYMQADPANGLCCFGRKHEAHLEYSHLLDRCYFYRNIEYMLQDHPMSSIVGELHVPGQPASSVITAMKSNPRDLQFTPFAMPWWDGRLNPAGLLDVNNELRRYAIGTPPETRYYEGETREQLDAMAINWQAEGVVLKEDHWSGFYKVKGEHTIDVVCTAIKPGSDGKYVGEAGSIHGSLWRKGERVEVACCSGMDDATRSSITIADIGRVFEVTYQYIGAGGRLRHPRFIRWRDDKSSSECGFNQLEAT